MALGDNYDAAGPSGSCANKAFSGAATNPKRFGNACFDPAIYGLRHDRMVNYVWICRKKLPEPQAANDALSSVPLHYLDAAFANAKTMPGVMVNLWLDYNQMNKATRFIVESHIYQNAPANIIARDLNMIDAYKNHPALGGDLRDKVNIRDRVDVARFMALNHCLNVSGIDRAYYMDFDAPALDLDSEKIGALLDSKGMAFGGVEYDDRLSAQPDAPRPKTISHGFIAVDRGGHEFLQNKLLPGLERFPLYKRSVVGMLCEGLIAREVGDVQSGYYNGNFQGKKIYESYISDVLMPDVDKPMPNAGHYAGICVSKVGLRL